MPILKRYMNMTEARIEFIRMNPNGGLHYLCRLFDEDNKQEAYDMETYDILLEDKVIRACDYSTDTTHKSNVILVLHAKDATLDQLQCIVGANRVAQGGSINGATISDYRSGRRTRVTKHSSNSSAYTIKCRNNASSKTVEIGMIQLSVTHCRGGTAREIIVQLSKPTANILKALIISYAIKLAHIVYKLHEPVGYDISQSYRTRNTSIVSHFQSLERKEEDEDEVANHKIRRPKMYRQSANLHSYHTRSRTLLNVTHTKSPVGPAELRLTGKENVEVAIPSAFKISRKRRYNS